MLIRDVMTPTPTCCGPGDTLDTVARLMVEHDCGEIPVCEGTRLVGVITDRDITCRAVAEGLAPGLVVAGDIMTRQVYTVSENGQLGDALEVMEKKLVRRLPVVDDAGMVIGILSQADLVAKAPTLKVARALRQVSLKTRKRAAASL